MAAMTISELARQGGVGVETVRYYQRRGLLADPQPGRRGYGAGIRHYDAGDLRRLRFIRSAQVAGFSLKDIARLLALDSGTDRAEARAMAQGRIAALDETIAQLQAARRSLSRLAQECAADAPGPCPIIASFEEAEPHCRTSKM